MKIVFFFVIVFFSKFAISETLDKQYYDLVRAAGLNSVMSEGYVSELVSTLDTALAKHNIQVKYTKEMQTEMVSIAREFFDSDIYMTKMASIYSQIFSVEEAKGLAEFYRSKHGKKFVDTAEDFEAKIESAREELYGEFSERITEVYLRDVK